MAKVTQLAHPTSQQ